MKGNANAPSCGFSTRMVASLKKHGKFFGDKDVLENPQYRYAVSKISSWPTMPQLFIGGEFVGGCGILTELDCSVVLVKLTGKAYSE